MKKFLILFLFVFCSQLPVNGQAKYSAQELNYFFKVALGAEYGNASKKIRKWNQDLRLQIQGHPTSEDLQTLNQVIQDLNTLLPEIQLKITSVSPNIKMFFVPERNFSKYLKRYVPTNMGYVYISWNNKFQIVQGTVLISTEKINQRERSHLIREELTQSLGLLNDAYDYKNSIFYQGWTSTHFFSPLDKRLIQILYDPRIKPGMNQQQVLKALN